MEKVNWVEDVPELIQACVAEPYPCCLYYQVRYARRNTEQNDVWTLEMERIATQSEPPGNDKTVWPFGLEGIDSEKRIELFEFVANKRSKSINIGSVYLGCRSCRSYGLGGFALSTMIDIMQPHYPDYSVESAALGDADGKGENGIRRDRLYLKCGFQIDAECTRVWADRFSQLTPAINTDKITRLSVDELFNRWIDSAKEAYTGARRAKSNKEYISYLEAELKKKNRLMTFLLVGVGVLLTIFYLINK